MKVGAERNKLIILVILLAVAGVLLYRQLLAPPDVAAPRPTAKTMSPARSLRQSPADFLEGPPVSRPRGSSRASNEFRPSLKKSKPGEGPDPLKIDPTLRTDLVAKVRAVDYAGVERNLFQFGAAKPKPTPEQIAQAKQQAAAAEAKLNPPPAPPPKPADPVAPPVNMRYYGYANRPGDARRRAFLLQGEDIIVAAEGEVINRRYRVVRIGVNSLVVEDLQFKSQQTLPLQES